MNRRTNSYSGILQYYLQIFLPQPLTFDHRVGKLTKTRQQTIAECTTENIRPGAVSLRIALLKYHVELISKLHE